MKKRKLKKGVKEGLYVVGFIALVGILFGLERTLFPSDIPDKDYQYVSKTLFDNVLPVVSESNVIKKPFTEEGVQIVMNFYDFQGTKEEQEDSLIYNDSTYLQSSGISYAKEDKPFDVVSILDGTVIDVKEDVLLGRIVEIRHSNDLISIYQSIDDITVKVNDLVTQGQVIGKSANANIEANLGNHLHFELIVKGQVVNPEDYYGKEIADL